MPFVTDPIGIIGEAEAAKMLEKKGFKVVEHNWRMGHLEIDLIAESKKEVVFAEVKARTTTFGDKTPEEYVDEDKKRRMIAAGNAYIKLKKGSGIPITGNRPNTIPTLIIKWVRKMLATE